MSNIQKEESIKKYLLKNIIITVVGFLAIVLLLVLIALWGINSYTRHGESVKIPSIRGLNLDDAQKILAENNLKSEVVASMYVGAKPGSVVEVIPEENSNVKKNRIIYLITEPTTPQMITIPDLTNFSGRQAFSRLKSLGFKQILTDYRPSVYKDAVLDVLYNGQSIAGTAQIPIDATITIVLGAGGEAVVDSIFDYIPDSTNLDNSINSDYIPSGRDNPYFE